MSLNGQILRPRPRLWAPCLITVHLEACLMWGRCWCHLKLSLFAIFSTDGMSLLAGRRCRFFPKKLASVVVVVHEVISMAWHIAHNVTLPLLEVTNVARKTCSIISSSFEESNCELRRKYPGTALIMGMAIDWFRLAQVRANHSGCSLSIQTTKRCLFQRVLCVIWIHRLVILQYARAGETTHSLLLNNEWSWFSTCSIYFNLPLLPDTASVLWHTQAHTHTHTHIKNLCFLWLKGELAGQRESTAIINDLVRCA